jgi:hypothetical protein
MNPSSLGALMAIGLGVAAPRPAAAGPFDVASFERPRVLAAAARLLAEEPRTVTAARSPRSAGGPHDFFSKAITGGPTRGRPYVQRDGRFLPRKLAEHRRASCG